MQPKTQICLLILYVGWGDRCVRRSEVSCSYCLLLGTSHIFWVLSASYWPRICWSASPWDLCVCQSSTRITRTHHGIQLLRTEIRFTCFQGNALLTEMSLVCHILGIKNICCLISLVTFIVMSEGYIKGPGYIYIYISPFMYIYTFYIYIYI